MSNDQPCIIITSRAIRDRYAALLEQQARERHKAAYEWTRLHWWQWRQRRRLARTLFGIGGWRVADLQDTGVLERWVPGRRRRACKFWVLRRWYAARRKYFT